MNKDAKMTVIYFEGKGRAEILRFILTFTKKDFTDRRIARADWPAAKPTMPLGQLPAMEFTDKDGKVELMCQSSALVRTLARIFDLQGKTPEQQARADEAFEALKEVQELGAKVMFEKDAATKETLQKQLQDELGPKIFAFLEKRAKVSGKSVSGGTEITYADLAVAQMVDTINSRPGLIEPGKLGEVAPTVMAIAKSILETQHMKEYLAKRPATEF